MTSLMGFFLAAGLIATLLFVGGYMRGVSTALATYDDDRVDVDTSGDIEAYGWKIGLGVISATLIIFMVGVTPAFVYVGPFLAIVTAAANGLAFFMERSPGQES